MGWHNLVNTVYFSEAANDFQKNNGRYCIAPRGSKDYFEYWEEQERRCIKGYKVGDIWIPGRYYFYLNFFPMSRASLEDMKSNRKTVTKEIGFPRFAEVQYEWWRFKHIAWNGGTFMGIESPGGRHICCAKTREAGFSYMEAADAVYNYTFIPVSKSYFAASSEQYLTKDGILNKVQEGLDFINMHIPYWKQNRMKKNTLLHQKASFLDSAGQEMGAMSEIMGLIVDNPHKTRGKRGRKFTFEEAGSFPKLKQAYEIVLGSMKASDKYCGQISVFGTGGEEGESIEGLEDMFNCPEAYDMLAFPNIWEYGGANDTCGYFVPCWRTNFGFMDDDGNVDIEGAVSFDDVEREKKLLSKDPKALDRRKAEFPRKPSEAFQRVHGNGFNTAEIDAQIKRIQSSQAIQGLIRYGQFIRSDSADALNGVEFINYKKEIAKPILEFPHKAGDDSDLSGCITIFEKPYLDAKGFVPEGIYQIVFDAYYKDDAEDRTSLFAIYVMKQDNNIDPSFAGLPVASYVGRPQRLRTCYDNLFMLADYYNCTVQGEIAGGGKGVLDHARQHRLLHKVEFEPEMVHNKEIASNMRNRAYLMNMTTDRKNLGMAYLIDWHTEERGIDEKGNRILNIHKIYDIPLLKEMKKAGYLNTDRVSALVIAMFMLKENITKKIHYRKNMDSFYSRSLFAESSVSGTTTAY